MPDSYRQLTVEQFLDALAAGTPSPGGGSAAALAGALAAALAGMVASLTIGREKYAAVDAEMREVRDRALELRLRLAGLVDEDAAAFASLLAARRLPHRDEDEERRRRATVAAALRAAIQAPLATVEASLGVLRLAEQVASHGNRTAAADAAVAALLALAALRGASHNALADLTAERDDAFVTETRERLDQLNAAGAEVAARVAAAVAGD